LSKPTLGKGPEGRVLEYKLHKFDTGVSQPAVDFLEIKKRMQNDFHLSEVISVQTGVSKVEAKALEDEVEQRTLDKLRDVQESAYQEAYALGLEEGRKEAFQKTSTEIDENLAQLSQMMQVLEKMKAELLRFNEVHLVKLVLHIATKIAHHEAQVNNDILVSIMKKAIETAQIEEEITVQVSPSQFDFLEKLKKETGRQFEFLKKVKLAPNDTVTVGGCIIETNYGVVDARLEERISKLWETMSENLYKVKDKIGAA
jgi:flagellar assembly protein FliH